MKPISEVVFEHQIKVFEAYKAHVKEHGLKIPSDFSKKRKMFVEWYLQEFDYDIQDVISDLATYFLFLSEQRTEVIIRNREKRERQD